MMNPHVAQHHLLLHVKVEFIHRKTKDKRKYSLSIITIIIKKVSSKSSLGWTKCGACEWGYT